MTFDHRMVSTIIWIMSTKITTLEPINPVNSTNDEDLMES